MALRVRSLELWSVTRSSCNCFEGTATAETVPVTAGRLPTSTCDYCYRNHCFQWVHRLWNRMNGFAHHLCSLNKSSIHSASDGSNSVSAGLLRLKGCWWTKAECLLGIGSWLLAVTMSSLARGLWCCGCCLNALRFLIVFCWSLLSIFLNWKAILLFFRIFELLLRLKFVRLLHDLRRH